MSKWNFILLPNVQTEPRSWLARSVLLGAQSVTAMIVGSSALLGVLYFILFDWFRYHFRNGDYD
jgi:hypothetical protein